MNEQPALEKAPPGPPEVPKFKQLTELVMNAAAASGIPMDRHRAMNMAGEMKRRLVRYRHVSVGVFQVEVMEGDYSTHLEWRRTPRGQGVTYRKPKE